jgi:hypothetical protein
MYAAAEHLSEIVIVNLGDHKDRPYYGNYSVAFTGADGKMREVTVSDHKRSDGYIKLFRLALEKLEK